MADPPTPHLHIDPPMAGWRVTPRNGRSVPVIATGHQPYLWHPGILAKYLAADVFAKQIGGGTLEVVVEHNVLSAIAVDVPLIRSHECLVSQRLPVDPRVEATELPPNRLAALDPLRVFERLVGGAMQEGHRGGDRSAAARTVEPIIKAFQQAGNHEHLAGQITAVLNDLKKPYIRSPISALPTSELVTPHFLDRLLADPINCVRCYNRAALSYPEAGIRPLYLGRDVVELPLWAQDATTCTPVFVDLGDSKRPQLFTTQHNLHLDLSGPDAIRYLRPRAVTLSALMRSEHCDLFIHGTGGGVYDRVTERWWRDWVGEPLAPMAVVSADVCLPFDVPVATHDELRHAAWFAHHLPHNLDRYTEPADEAEAALVSEKHGLLDRMHDDRDKRRRARAFQRIHAINHALRQRHEDQLARAGQAAVDARVGVHNATIANRRDWCFALYPEAQLKALRQQIAERPGSR